ncbi:MULTISPECIES: ABC transporter ATP-binding protein [unclassified Chelatococcus]|uniref:ABC transporter ATP-binding protein n=1 Tax=unclassified Chelatococcus TaxID=2638111 RepID=UPI001BCDCF09|nr:MULTISPECIES: ABC transporter ATP-binding protein [unclassified Chelatococcus]MBS7696699.1 ABC transporter ATP-binding protein [Chelatococcus sp. YT9]MBX3555264.1 ABC transporter ATP-binding protein [Chelatococcus sp.]
MTATYLELKALRKSYDGTTNAVSAVSLTVAKGEFVSFLGPSGSGKTTTLMLIAGFEQADSGEINLEGRSLGSLPASKRNIGIVFQNYALFPHMTIRKNAEFSLRMRGVPRAAREARAQAALDRVGLGHLAHRRPRELSGGQQQRAALARALIFEPDILLLDEPLGALDKNLRERMQIEIKSIQKELGITTIYVTHDQSEAMTLSDRIVVFSHGVIEQCAPPLEVYGRPASRFVAEFVGDCNFIGCVVSDPTTGVIDIPAMGRCQLTGLAARRLAHCPAGAKIELALRPEMIALASPEKAGGLTAPMTVEGVVNYGNSVVLFGQMAGTPLSVRLSNKIGARVVVGDTLSLAIDPEDFWPLT